MWKFGQQAFANPKSQIIRHIRQENDELLQVGGRRVGFCLPDFSDLFEILQSAGEVAQQDIEFFLELRTIRFGRQRNRVAFRFDEEIEFGRALESGGPLLVRDVAQLDIQNAMQRTDAQAVTVCAGTPVEPFNFLLAVFRLLVSSGIDGEEERRTFDLAFDRLIKDFVPGQARVAPDFQFAPGQLLQPLCQQPMQTRDPAARTFFPARVVVVRVADKDVVLEAGYKSHRLSPKLKQNCRGAACLVQAIDDCGMSEGADAGKYYGAGCGAQHSIGF